MMDHMVQCGWLWAAVHLFIAVVTAITAVSVAFINTRNTRVDRLRDEADCKRCAEHRKRYHHLHQHELPRSERERR
jgi:hypothetical protein